MMRKKLKGLWMLLRVIPVVSWSFSGVLLGVSVVIHHLGQKEINLFNFFLVLISTVLLQGIIAHAYNDLIDWETGTDRYSPGILSGGSKVLPQQMMRKGELTWLASCSILIVFMIAIYFVLIIGIKVLIFLFVGLWAAVAYNCSPFKLAYRPWFGEWFCAWPAMIACTVGTSYVLSEGHLFIESWILGMLHATFSITWLMMHHIPDIEADLKAIPPKWTTIAYLKKRKGWQGVDQIIKCYLLLALTFAVSGGLLLRRLELLFIPGLLIIIVYYGLNRTRMEQIEAVTNVELLTIGITIVNAIGLSWFLIYS